MVSLTGWFIGAQLLLGLILWGVHYRWRRPPNLAKRSRNLDDITDTDLWAAEGLKELGRSVGELVELDEHADKLEKRAETSRGLGVSWAQSIVLLVFCTGTWLFLYQSEALIGTVLNLTSGFFSLTPEQAAFAGPLLAIGAFMITHTAILAWHKPQRARRTWRWAGTGTLISLLGVGAAWVVFLSGRTVTPDELLTAGVEIEATLMKTIYALGLLNAVAAAFVGTIIVLLLEDQFVAREIERTEAQMRRVAQHVIDLVRELRSQNVEIPSDIEEQLPHIEALAKPTGKRIRVSRLAPTTTVVAMLLIPIATQAQVAVPQPLPNARVVVSLPPDGTCEPMFDVSTSTDIDARKQALSLFVDQLESFIDTKGCRIVRAWAFSGSPYTAVLEFNIPPKPLASTPCQPTPTDRRAIDVMFPDFQKVRVQLKTERCAERARLEESEALKRRQDAIAAVGHRLQATVQATTPQGECTALDAAISLALNRSREVVAVTDAFSTCAFGTRSTQKWRDYSRLTVLLVPTKDNVGDIWGEFINRLDALKAKYPGAHVHPYSELTSTFWQR